MIPWSSSFVDTPSGNENILFVDLHTIMGVPIYIFSLLCFRGMNQCLQIWSYFCVSSDKLAKSLGYFNRGVIYPTRKINMLYIGNYHDKFGLNCDFFRKKIKLYCFTKKQQHIRHTNTVALKIYLQKVKSIKNFFLFFSAWKCRKFWCFQVQSCQC